MPSFATHLESAIDGSRHPIDRPQTTHEGRPFWVRYDLDAVARHLDRDELAHRRGGFWRFRELLPVERAENRLSLGERTTALIPCKRLGDELGLRQLFIKDESCLPTGSFKARGLCLAVSRALELGLKRLAIPTAGNAGGAMAAYAARAGLEAYVFMPADTPLVNRAEANLFGAKVTLVDGLITDCGAMVAAGTEPMGWFDCSTLKEPYRLEGKKTMGLELAEQLEWTLPDWIFYPTGGGTGLIGMWKAFAELETLGWLENNSKPRMVACQADGCAPIVRAFEAGERFADPIEAATTQASGLRVPKAVGDFMILDAVRASNGSAESAPEAELIPLMKRASALEGISLCPESAACLSALKRMVRDGRVQPDERIVVFNTGAAQKYPDLFDPDLRCLAPSQLPDWSQLASNP